MLLAVQPDVSELLQAVSRLEHRPYTLYLAYGRIVRAVRSTYSRRIEATIRTVQYVLYVCRTMPTRLTSHLLFFGIGPTRTLDSDFDRRK